MGGEFSIDTDFVRWFTGKGPKHVIGSCPHDCRHMGMANIAWGPDAAHYTLNECTDCGCRAWDAVEQVGTKPRSLRRQSDLDWMQVV